MSVNQIELELAANTGPAWLAMEGAPVTVSFPPRPCASRVTSCASSREATLCAPYLGTKSRRSVGEARREVSP